MTPDATPLSAPPLSPPPPRLLDQLIVKIREEEARFENLDISVRTTRQFPLATGKAAAAEGLLGNADKAAPKVLVTMDSTLPSRVNDELRRQMADLPTSDVAGRRRAEWGAPSHPQECRSGRCRTG